METLLHRFAQKRDIHQTLMYANVMRTIGWDVVGKPGEQFFMQHIGPFSAIKAQRIEHIDPSYIKELHKTSKSFFTLIEPALSATIPSNLQTVPFHNPYAHTKTSLIDLHLSQQILLKNMKQKTRYNIHLATRKYGIDITQTPFAKLSSKIHKDLDTIQTAWKQINNHHLTYPSNFFTAMLHEFRNDGTVLIAYENAIPLASLYVIEYDGVAIYYSAFSTQRGYATYAPTALTWEAIQIAQQHKCDIFDFGGIYDERFPKTFAHWQGFTAFKEGFSPTPVYYPKPKRIKLFGLL